jgi:general stress protein 26
MGKEKLVKFRHENIKGIFHYDTFEGCFVVLSKIDSGKIDYIKEHGAIDITFDIEEENYDVMAAEIVEDKDYVQKVYDHFKETENAWFENGIEGLCVLKFHK